LTLDRISKKFISKDVHFDPNGRKKDSKQNKVFKNKKRDY